MTNDKKVKKTKKNKKLIDNKNKRDSDDDFDPAYARASGHIHLLGHSPIGGRGREWR